MVGRTKKTMMIGTTIVTMNSRVMNKTITVMIKSTILDDIDPTALADNVQGHLPQGRGRESWAVCR